MRAALERLEKNQVSLQIEVEAEQVAEAMQKAYRRVVKRVNIPGFRKGRAPRPILEARLGKEVLYEDALDILIPKAYQEAVQEKEVEPIDQPKIEVIKLEEGQPLIFKATVEVLPEVELGDYKGVAAVKPEVKVGDDEVEAQLKLLQQRHARLVDAGEGPVDDGNYAIVNVTATVDGKPEPRLKAQEQPVEVGAGKFIPGFDAQLLGMKVGEEKEFTLHLPSLYKYPDLEGKDACFKIKLVGLKRKELNPLDDDFARDVSNCTTLEELKEELRNKLEEVGQANARRIFTERVVAKVVEQARVELPEVLVQRQVEQDTQDFIRRLAFQRLNMEDYLRITKKDFDTVRQELEAGARETVKRSLVLEAIAKAEGIKVTPEEVDAEVNDLAAQYNLENDKLRKSLEERGELASVEKGLRIQKVQDFLRDHAIELPDTEPEAGDAGTKETAPATAGTGSGEAAPATAEAGQVVQEG